MGEASGGNRAIEPPMASPGHRTAEERAEHIVNPDYSIHSV